MLYFYQRPGETVHHWPTLSRDLWTPPGPVPIGEYLIVIQDADEVSSFTTLADCPPVFVSLRRGVDGLEDETVVGIPDGYPGEGAEQLAAAQIETALAAAEVLPADDRDRIAADYGLMATSSGPRSMRPCGGPAGEICVSVFYEELRDDFTLSKKSPALSIITQQQTVCLADDPAMYATAYFDAAARGLRAMPKKARQRLGVEYGIDMRTFLSGPHIQRKG